MLRGPHALFESVLGVVPDTMQCLLLWTQKIPPHGVRQQMLLCYFALRGGMIRAPSTTSLYER